MPRTPHGVVNEDALRQRPAVMRTGRADREELAAAACDQNGLVADMAGQHAAVRQLVDRDAQRQVGTPRVRIRFFHRGLLQGLFTLKPGVPRP